MPLKSPPKKTIICFALAKKSVCEEFLCILSLQRKYVDKGAVLEPERIKVISEFIKKCSDKNNIILFERIRLLLTA